MFRTINEIALRAFPSSDRNLLLVADYFGSIGAEQLVHETKKCRNESFHFRAALDTRTGGLFADDKEFE